MQTDNFLLVVCLTLFLVIGLNAALYAALRRGNEANQIELLRQAARRARQPWKDEDDALQELSRLVAPFKPAEPGEAVPPDPPGTKQD